MNVLLDYYKNYKKVGLKNNVPMKVLEFTNKLFNKRLETLDDYMDDILEIISLSLSLSLCFSWLLVSLASTSFCGLASTDFSSGLASTGFFGFVLSGVLQKSFASY